MNEFIREPAAGQESWFTIRTGVRADDVWCAISKDSQRLCFHTSIETAVGRELEHLTKDARLHRHGVVIWDARWKNFYVMARHAGYTASDYFIHAARLLAEHRIEEP